MMTSQVLNFDRRDVLKCFAAVLLTTATPLSADAQQSADSKVKIGVIGAGHIGSTIGGLWVKAGHPILFSSRHPEGLQELVASLGSLAHSGSVSDAIASADVIFVAVP